MATNFKIVEGQDYNVTTFDTKANATAIADGDLVCFGKTNAGYAEFCPATAVNTDSGFGVAISDGTHTASADGTVQVAWSENGLEVEGKVDTAGNLTQARIGTAVTLDVSSTTQTVDENDTTIGFFVIWRYPDGSLDTTDGVHRFKIFSGWTP